MEHREAKTREGRVFQKVLQERRLDWSPKSRSLFSGVEAVSQGQGGQAGLQCYVEQGPSSWICILALSFPRVV